MGDQRKKKKRQRWGGGGLSGTVDMMRETSGRLWRDAGEVKGGV